MTLLDLVHRPRRLRQNASIRALVRETTLSASDLIQPLFIHDGEAAEVAIPSMPGQARLNLEACVETCVRASRVGIPAVALFPSVESSRKSEDAREAWNPEGLIPRAVKAIKKACPELLVICDVALDPYSSLGQDGVVRDGTILNDLTVAALVKQARMQAEAGADIVAPSDMMDGRVGAIRNELDSAGQESTMILAYTAKYASGFYGPFRDALDSAPRGGTDKKTYQMDPGNAREALRELYFDIQEGADMVMVKPALPYLDIVRELRDSTEVPIAAYHVSGEYAMLKAAAQKGWLDWDACIMESLVSIKRAGADCILTYAAIEVAERFLRKQR